MFHTIMLISYLIPGLYLFLRIRQLFISTEHRLVFTLTFAFLFSIYPLGNYFNGSAGRILDIISGYLLPLFLYVFLLLLLTDLLLLINLIFSIIPPGRLKGRSFRYRILLSIITISLLIVTGGIINFNTIRISGYKVEAAKRSSRISSLRIAFVSDFHLQESTPVRFVERFVDKIESVKPDLMLFGGDIAEGDGDYDVMKKFTELIGRIKATYGVYGVLGNHEHYSGHDQGTFFERAGIKILRDSAVIFCHSFTLAGRNDSHTRNRISVEELLENLPDSLPLILIDHRPTEIEQVSTTRTDIQFSGHTHNGQLFPIHFITNRVYLLSWGYKKFGNTHFFVSSGIRLWGPPVRTTGKSEIMVVDVNFI